MASASARGKCEPIGLVGSPKAGSCSSTTTCVISVATGMNFGLAPLIHRRATELDDTLNSAAGSTTAAAQANGVAGAGKVTFVPSTGNVLALTYIDAAGWKATMTNPAVTGSPNTCGIYTGPAANTPNAAVTQEGSPACW